jgi:hypothetical protein
MLSYLRLRFRALFGRRVVETELEGELRFHFENEVHKYKGRGMASDEVLRLARLWEPHEFRLLGKTSTVFQILGAFRKQFFSPTGETAPERPDGASVSAGLLPAPGVSPLLGRMPGKR